MFLSLTFSHQIVSCIAAGEIAVQAAVHVLGSGGFLDGSQRVICLGNCDLGNFGLFRARFHAAFVARNAQPNCLHVSACTNSCVGAVLFSHR